MADINTAETPPVYRGIRMRDGKWMSETRDPLTNTRYWLGTYATREKAAIAYDAAVYYFRGQGASLNFPHMATVLPRPPTSSKEDVRKACKKASLLLEPSIGTGSSSLPTHIQLLPTQIQAIRDSPLDCYETWMEANCTYVPF
ncbi:ethylene-responsive transcription factor ERF021-like [Cynara cardunculus var. scolymus]|uniref:AP2/ERF domain-containing protein n=1 Tax=Cynara cardunculus var. scolymus TaxID=59895 RepID=A0A118JW40_CYNCS|nr:ethylene-responsive transcription factor ERF021-like [Cynara cardunculus var. scolymus]KVH95062.1 AP2/ERF domain-containing protein [Cynara cardunculus var. scolymus]